MARLRRLCDGYGLPLRRPSVFPRNGLLAARVACSAAGAAWQADFVRNVYRANFADDRDIADVAVVSSILVDLGQSAEAILAAAQAADNKQRLRAETDEAIRRGVFGAPSFTVGDELFWGNDRLEAAIEWCRAANR